MELRILTSLQHRRLLPTRMPLPQRRHRACNALLQAQTGSIASSCDSARMDMDFVFLAIGAAGAVLAMLLFVVLNDAWIHGLLPLWRRWRYRGVDLSGGWKGLGNAAVPASGEWTEVGLSFEQRTRELRGQLWIRRCSADRISQLLVPLSGRISDGYVTLAAAVDGESTVAHAAALLKVDARGSCLTGQLLYQDADTGSVDGIHLSVYRASSMELPRLRPLPMPAGIGSVA